MTMLDNMGAAIHISGDLQLNESSIKTIGETKVVKIFTGQISRRH